MTSSVIAGTTGALSSQRFRKGNGFGFTLLLWHQNHDGFVRIFCEHFQEITFPVISMACILLIESCPSLFQALLFITVMTSTKTNIFRLVVIRDVHMHQSIVLGTFWLYSSCNCQLHRYFHIATVVAVIQNDHLGCQRQLN